MTELFAFIRDRLFQFFGHSYHMYRYFVRCLKELRHVYFYRRQVIDHCYTIGVGSLFLVCLVSAFGGMAMSIMIAYQMEAYVPDYMVGSMLVRSVLLSLAPVLTCLVLAGRVGAGIASEVGTMKVSEQVDALTSLAVDPVGYLMMPRMLAGLLMIPVLVIFSSFVAIFTGFVTSVQEMDISIFNFVKGMKLDFRTYDFIVGIAKATVFGGLITFVGCYVGLETDGGAQGVGRSATAAVVISAALILVLDYFLNLALLY